MLRRTFLALTLCAAAALTAIATGVKAHHGWSWTDGGQFKLTGIIEFVRLGNPHGRVTVDADGEKWLVEVGQPWRNERAGLKDAMLKTGVEITVLGERSADADEKRVKAESVIIGDKEYVLYPDRI